MEVVAGQLPPYPDGWYALAMSAELAPGQVMSRPFAGAERVLFRGRSGRVAAVGAYCPHLGAHMGHGGTVVEDTLRCPFHGFRFGGDGRCVALDYGTKAPPTARVPALDVVEQNGVILAWHGQAAPTWSVPVLDDADWTPPVHRTMTLRSHPQETTENSVDLGHLGAVHGYRDVAMRGEPRVEGPTLRLDYTMSRKNPFLAELRSLTTDFDVIVHGLGYSLVDIRPRAMPVHLRLWVLPSPREGGVIDLRIAVSVERRFPIPGGLVEQLIGAIAIRAVEHDVRQDFDIWQHKIWVERPVLALGDGPVPLYRRWCRQFYPGEVLAGP